MSDGPHDPMGGLEIHHPHQPFTPSPEMPILPPDQPVGITNAMWESLVHRIAALEDALRSITQDHRHLVQAHETLTNRHQELSASHDKLAKDADGTREALALDSSSRNRTSEPKIPDPPLYSGDRKELLIWLMKCQMKFEGQPSKFQDLRAKMIYVGTRLDGPAFAWFQPLMEKWPVGASVDAESIPAALKSWAAFKKAINDVFGDPNLAATAERELRNLHQTKSVAEYAAQFEAKRQYLAWNDIALRDQFYLGLKEEVKDDIAPIGKPADLAGLKDLAIRLDSRLHERRLERQGYASRGQSKPTTTANSRGYSAPPRTYSAPSTTVPPLAAAPSNSTSPAPATATAPRPGPVLSADGTIPMELDANGVYRLSMKEKQRRRQFGLCDYCGASNHLWRNCPVRPPSRNPPRGQGVMSFEFSAPAEMHEGKGETEE